VSATPVSAFQRRCERLNYATELDGATRRYHSHFNSKTARQLCTEPAGDRCHSLFYLSLRRPCRCGRVNHSLLYLLKTAVERMVRWWVYDRGIEYRSGRGCGSQGHGWVCGSLAAAFFKRSLANRQVNCNPECTSVSTNEISSSVDLVWAVSGR